MRTADLGMFPGLAVFVWAEFGLRGVVGVARHYGDSVADRREQARHYGNSVADRRGVARHSVFAFAVRRAISRRPAFSRKLTENSKKLPTYFIHSDKVSREAI